MSLLRRLRASLRRTADQLGERLDEIVRRNDTSDRDAALDIESVEDLEALLIEADVGVTATQRIITAVRAEAHEGRSLRALIRHEILQILDRAGPSVSNGSWPRVVLVVGVNGTGKTTTVGKLARRLREDGGHPLICAADTFRAAAVEQLEVWARRAGVDIVRARSGADPAAVVFDAIQAGRARDRDIVIVDTAGRLHTRVNLMTELEKIRRVAAREVEGAPHEVLLVLDATVGQNGLAQAREFLARAAVTGIVLAKLDGTARGGIAVAIASELGVPIRYVGIGEGIDDLLPFSAEDYVDALFEESWA